MTVVNTTTGEVAGPSYGEVRESIETTKSHLERAAEQVVWQIENRAWLVLGYASWDEMREAEYKGAAVIVPRADRPELVMRLRAGGLSQQQVASTIGVSQGTVATDEANINSDIDLPATRTDTRGHQRPTTYKTTSTKPPATKGQGDIRQELVEDAAPMVGAAESQDGRSPGETPVRADVVDDDTAACPAATASEIAEASEAVQDARYLENFAAAIAKATEYRTFDAERIGRLAGDDDIRTLELAAKYSADFLERVKRARTGLRVITGGRA